MNEFGEVVGTSFLCDGVDSNSSRCVGVPMSKVPFFVENWSSCVLVRTCVLSFASGLNNGEVSFDDSVGFVMTLEGSTKSILVRAEFSMNNTHGDVDGPKCAELAWNNLHSRVSLAKVKYRQSGLYSQITAQFKRDRVRETFAGSSTIQNPDVRSDVSCCEKVEV